jgi:hypothetical protein
MSDGFYYSGYFRHDKFNGNGEVRYIDKSTYTGNFKNGLEDGKGRMIKVK